MGRQPCCDKVGLKKGPWTAEEDKKLINFILTNGQCCWRAVPKLAGLLRCGKSCRLRWTNYLRPDLKRGLLSDYEEQIVIEIHAKLGNRWSKIASHLPGRTDNEIKNHWNTHIKKKLKKIGIDPLTHKPIGEQQQPDHHQQPQVTQHEHPPSQPNNNNNHINHIGDHNIIKQGNVHRDHQAKEAAAVVGTPPVLTSSTNDITGGDHHDTKLDLELEFAHTISTPDHITASSPFSGQEYYHHATTTEAIDSFCVEEVPLIGPHEILVPCDDLPPYTTSSTTADDHHNYCPLTNTSSSSLLSLSTSSSNSSCGSPSIFEDLALFSSGSNWLGYGDHDGYNDGNNNNSHNILVDSTCHSSKGNNIEDAAGFSWEDEEFDLDLLINVNGNRDTKLVAVEDPLLGNHFTEMIPNDDQEYTWRF